ncbi:MAG: ATP-binding protein [Candidatus Eisenbacteria bacterium]|nr:ATP-binding protein [Candidatus Eisenbacteria bacterium]
MRESFPRTRTVIVARLFVAVVIVLAALLGGSSVARLAIVILGGIALALTVVYFLWHKAGGHSRLLLLVQCAVDVVFITLVAHFSGGLGSPFKLFYFLPVIVASGRLGLRPGLAVAAGAVVGHVVLVGTDPSSWSYLIESGAVTEIVILLVSLLLVALLEGQLARKAGESEDSLRATRSELDTAELRIADILDGISSGLALIDNSGSVAYLNRAGETILGISGGGVRGGEYRIVFADVPAFCERIAAALDAGRPEVRVEFFVKRKGGGSTPVGLSTSILRSDKGEERGVIAIFQDLTGVRQMEERLRHDDRLSALGEFAAGVAHEIRNPLYAIKGSIDLLKETIEPKGDEVKLIELVSREADRLNTLLQDVLQYGKMESGDRESVRLDTLLREVAELARRHPAMAQTTDLAVEATDQIEGVINAEQIRRALLNLTINALESIEGEGRVRLSLVPEAEFAARGLAGGSGCGVALVVEDTGHGIPVDRKDEVFQPFQTTKKGGTGLGLAIVDKTVQAHGGRIAVVSEPGKGSRFIMYLPA